MDDNQLTAALVTAAVVGIPTILAAAANAILTIRNGWKADENKTIANAAVQKAKEAKEEAAKGTEQNNTIIAQNADAKVALAKVEKQTNGAMSKALEQIAATQAKLDSALEQIVTLNTAAKVTDETMKKLAELSDKEARHSRRNEEQIQALKKAVEDYLTANPHARPRPPEGKESPAGTDTAATEANTAATVAATVANTAAIKEASTKAEG